MFRFDERFDIAVPFEMQEEYKFDNGTRVAAIATYDRFRRFDVSTDEDIRAPEANGDGPEAPEAPGAPIRN